MWLVTPLTPNPHHAPLRRVLYLDIDVHHGDGVEEAFYTTGTLLGWSAHLLNQQRVWQDRRSQVDVSEQALLCSAGVKLDCALAIWRSFLH